MNRSIFNYIFSFSRNPYIANLAIFFSYHLLAIVVSALLFWSLSYAPRKAYTLMILFGSGLSSVLLAEIFKIIFIVDRPYKVLDIIPLVKSFGFSFPSGHAALVASFAVAGYALNTKFGILLTLFAIFVGLSRIVIGAHYPLDVLMGWLLGAVVGTLFVIFCNKI